MADSITLDVRLSCAKMTETEFDARMDETQDTHRWQSEVERLKESRDNAQEVKQGTTDGGRQASVRSLQSGSMGWGIQGGRRANRRGNA